MRKIFLLTLIISLSFFPLKVSLSQVGRTGVPFLMTTPDARGHSLADGGSVYSTGAISSYYNPANLVSCGTAALEISKTKMLQDYADDIYYRNIYLARSFNGVYYFGVNLNYLSLGTQSRIDEWGNTINDFATHELAFGITGAVALDPNNSVGFGFKYIESYLSDMGAGPTKGSETARSIAFDMGILSRNHFPQATFGENKVYYPTLRKYCRTRSDRGFAFGASISNIGPGISYLDADQKDPLPRRIRLAAGYQVIDMDELGLRASIDATHLLLDLGNGFKTEWDETIWSYGFEANFLYFVNLRAGKVIDRSGENKYWVGGFGVGPDWLHIDYSHLLGHKEIYRLDAGPTVSLYFNLPIGYFN